MRNLDDAERPEVGSLILHVKQLELSFIETLNQSENCNFRGVRFKMKHAFRHESSPDGNAVGSPDKPAFQENFDAVRLTLPVKRRIQLDEILSNPSSLFPHGASTHDSLKIAVETYFEATLADGFC